MSGSLCRVTSVSVNLRIMKNRPSGFTLIELLVVLTIVGILVAMALPSFNTLLMRRSVQSAAVALVTDIRYARSEALRRSGKVSICSLAAGSTNTCSPNPGPGEWVNGWMVFTDTDITPGTNLGTYQAATEEIIRVQQPPANILSILHTTPANTRRAYTFEANGVARQANDTLVVIPTTAGSATNNRVICVSITGRPSIRAEGVVNCLP